MAVPPYTDIKDVPDENFVGLLKAIREGPEIRRRMNRASGPRRGIVREWRLERPSVLR